jgi:hypothetical protein
MGMTLIDLDTKNLPLEDFMKAMGFEPIDRNNNLLTYESPYSANGNIVVDTDANGWYDKEQPEKMYGGIYDLAYEIIGSANKSELNLFIASEMKKVRDVKMYDVTANDPERKQERPQRKRGMRL